MSAVKRSFMVNLWFSVEWMSTTATIGPICKADRTDSDRENPFGFHSSIAPMSATPAANSG
jgi:hypothetical protein